MLIEPGMDGQWFEAGRYLHHLETVMHGCDEKIVVLGGMPF